MPEDEFVALCATTPAIHRFPGSMGKRVHQVCRVLVDRYEGRAENVWADASSGDEVLEASALAARIRTREGGHLHRAAGQAARRDPARLA